MYDKSLTIRVTPTDKTPLLEFLPRDMIFNMIGVSIPDDAKTFYTPILEWIEEFTNENIEEPIVINIDLDYFSIQSASILLKMIKIFSVLPKVTVNWFYDDPDTEEIGRDLAYMVTITFNFINKNNRIWYNS